MQNEKFSNLEEIFVKGHELDSRWPVIHLLKKRHNELDVVVFTNSNRKVPEALQAHAREILHLSIDDVCTPEAGKIHITAEYVQMFLDWTVNRSKVVCCCHAGVSRSSAAAYIIAARAWGSEKALAVLRGHAHYPNKLIVQIGSELLKDDTIWTNFVTWTKNTYNYDLERNPSCV